MVTKSFKSKILIILGPTSTGKTDLALSLANRFNSEVVACDSRQVYRGLDVGTGKLPSGKVTIEKGRGFWKINGVKVWMYDVVNLKKQYTVVDYVKDANRIINKILKKGKPAILVGGTGLYFKALLEGLSNLGIPADMQLRRILSSLFLEQLQKKLQVLSPKKWDGMNSSDRQNPRRLIRAIEVEDSHAHVPDGAGLGITRNDILKIGLDAPREILYNRINNKVLEWIQFGIIDEVKEFFKKGVTKKRINELGLEYAVAAEYLDKKISLDEMIEKMQNKVRQYAKRQITWFKKEKNVFWFDITKRNRLTKIDNLIIKWYDTPIRKP